LLYIAVPSLLLGVLAAAFVTFHLVRLGVWICRGGGPVVMPWSTAALPARSPFAQLLCTRDASKLAPCSSGSCALVFWKRPRGAGLAAFLCDAITGFTGIYTVAADCSLEAAGELWLMKSAPLDVRSRRINGPHYMPLSACTATVMTRVDVSGHIDGNRLLCDLEERISCSTVRHKGSNPLPYLFGRTHPDRVTCSSFIGLAILRQESAPLARALRQALDERFTYGEISPPDLARAMAILGLYPEGSDEPIRTVSLRTGLRRLFGTWEVSQGAGPAYRSAATTREWVGHENL